MSCPENTMRRLSTRELDGVEIGIYSRFHSLRRHCRQKSHLSGKRVNDRSRYAFGSAAPLNELVVPRKVYRLLPAAANWRDQAGLAG